MSIKVILISFFSLFVLQIPLALAEPIRKATDFDNDGNGDLVLYNKTSSVFQLRNSSNGEIQSIQIGSTGDIPVSGNFNGKGGVEVGTFNPTTATWNLHYGSGDKTVQFGKAGAVPVPGNYSSTKCTDLATFSRSDGSWRFLNCEDDITYKYIFGGAGSIPVPGDYDCDKKTDMATFKRGSNEWKYKSSKTGETVKFIFGLNGDIPTPGDFNNDGCTQAAVYRPWNNYYYVANRKHNGLETLFQWGLNGDTPSIVNVDSGGVDYSVFRPRDNQYYISSSTNSFFQAFFGPLIQQSAAAPIVPGSDELPPEIVTVDGEDLDDFDFFDDDDDGGDFSFDFGSIDNLFSSFFRGTRSTAAQQILPLSHSRPLTSPDARHSKVPGNFNGDNQTDILLVSAGTTTKEWSILHGDGTSSRYAYGRTIESRLIPADYDGDGRINPAFVRKESGFLNWYVLDANNQNVVELYGLEGDKPLAGDFDCDGKADKAVGRPTDGFLVWFIKLSSGELIENLSYGLANDRPFVADMNGDGCDEIVLAQDQAGGIWWFYYNLQTEKGSGPVQWGLSADDLIAPTDFNGDGRADYIVARDFGGGKTSYILHNGTGEPGYAIAFGLEGDTLLTGFFSGINQAELAVYRPGKDGGPSSIYTRHYNGFISQRIYGTFREQALRADGSLNSSSFVTGNGVSCDFQSDFFDGDRRGALWKPVSDNTRKPVILLPSSYWTAVTEIKIFGSNGQQVASGSRRTCCPNGGRAHYDVNMSAYELQQFAPITVQLTLNQGSKECRTVTNPAQRED